MRIAIAVGLAACSVQAEEKPKMRLTAGKRFNEYVELPGLKKEHIINKAVHDFSDVQVPNAFTWQNVDGRSYVTKTLNQHIPQYCGSCWAHGAVSALSDRIKISRKAAGADINLAVQHLLNCGGEVAGSCYGGSHMGAYQWMKDNGIAYDTGAPYMACSSDSDEGFCGVTKDQWKCEIKNIARTCSTFTENGGKCVGLTHYPNATVTEYGTVSGAENMKKEIYKRGPIACGIDADNFRSYQGGVLNIPNGTRETNHVISVVGWGQQADGSQYWIGRNSWGEYWGEMGYFKLHLGDDQAAIEEECAWAVPGDFTTVNFPCNEDGSGCLEEHPDKSWKAFDFPTKEPEAEPEVKPVAAEPEAEPELAIYL